MDGVFRPTINLGNSVIGVGILAMPYCIQKCGLILGVLLLAASAMFTIWSLKMLVRAAHISRKASYEQLAFHTFGRHGKLVIELSIIGLMIGCLIAFFIVIGDLTPPIVAQLLGIKWSPTYLRMFLMIFLTCTVSLPLSLLRNVDSLSGVAMCSLFFYFCLCIRVIFMSLSTITGAEVWSTVSLVKFDGLLHCLPICALGLSCHPQMFVIYVQMADPSVRKMSTVISGAISMVATGYGVMAFFGYMNFFQDGVKGDVLANFPHDGVSQLFRFGFSISVVVSFPLVMFPVRASIYSLFFSKSSGSMELHSSEPIPSKEFNLITFSIILSTLTVAILVPNVESVLALTGATTGSIISYIGPSLIFLSIVGSHAVFSNRAKFLLILGFIVMIIGTTTIIRDKLRPMDEDSTTGKYVYPRPFVPPAPIVEVKGPEIVEDFKLPPAGGLPLPGDNDIINNDIIVEDVMHQQVVPAAVDLSPNEKRVKENADIEEVREIGDGVQSEGVNGERVEGGEGKGLKDEHESIKKDMEELKERIKAVEEENQELKDVLEKQQVNMIGDEAAGAAVKPVDPRITDDADSPVAQSPGEEQPRDNDEGAIERLNLDLKQTLKEEQLFQQVDPQEFGNNEEEVGQRGEGGARKRGLETDQEDKHVMLGDMDDPHIVEDINEEKEEVKQEREHEVEEFIERDREARGEDTEREAEEEGVREGEVRKVRELKAMTDKS